MTRFQSRRPQSYLQNGLSESRQLLCAGRIYQVLALGLQTIPPNGRGHNNVTNF